MPVWQNENPLYIIEPAGEKKGEWGKKFYCPANVSGNF